MIFDKLFNSGRYADLHPLFAAAFRFLGKKGLSGFPDGRYEIDGDRLYAIILRNKGRGRKSAKLEAHRRYIDIHFSLGGIDEIGWKPAKECVRKQSRFSAKKDCGFFSDAPRAWVPLIPRSFVIFFPEDAHAPSCGKCELHKVIVKVEIDLSRRK
jgi:biofilm protein TabA